MQGLVELNWVGRRQVGLLWAEFELEFKRFLILPKTLEAGTDAIEFSIAGVWTRFWPSIWQANSPSLMHEEHSSRELLIGGEDCLMGEANLIDFELRLRLLVTSVHWPSSSSSQSPNS
jgi:hypothetical protein